MEMMIQESSGRAESESTKQYAASIKIPVVEQWRENDINDSKETFNMVTLPDAMSEINKTFDSPPPKLYESRNEEQKRGSMTINYGNFGVITGLDYTRSNNIINNIVRPH